MSTTSVKPEVISRLMALGYSYKDASWLSKRVKSKNFLKKVPNPTYPRLSKPAQKRVSAKIAKLIREGYDKAQAAAISYSMERKHQIGLHGGKKKNPSDAFFRTVSDSCDGHWDRVGDRKLVLWCRSWDQANKVEKLLKPFGALVLDIQPDKISGKIRVDVLEPKIFKKNPILKFNPAESINQRIIEIMNDHPDLSLDEVIEILLKGTEKSSQDYEYLKAKQELLSGFKKSKNPEDRAVNSRIAELMNKDPRLDLDEAIATVMEETPKKSKDYEYLSAMLDLVINFKKGKV